MSTAALILAMALSGGGPCEDCPRRGNEGCGACLGQCLRDCFRYHHWPYTRAYYLTWPEYDYRTEFDYPWYGRPHRLVEPYPAGYDPECETPTPTRIIERVPPPGVPFAGKRPSGAAPRQVKRPNALRLAE